MKPIPLTIRPSLDTDVEDITTIYRHAVEHGTGTFELEAPAVDEMRSRRAAVLARQWPFLVAESQASNGTARVVGYAYANDFRPRRAYRFCLEDSIYVAPDVQGQGAGSMLLAELVSRCEARGARQMLAVIGDSANRASIRLHEQAGFEHTGVLRASGWKFDAWRDVILMQRPLGPGAANAPKD